jgi:hypothetical protein
MELRTSLAAAAPDAMLAEGRLVDALAGGGVLVGTPDELAARLGLTLAAFGAALQALLGARWIVVQAHQDGRLSLRWECRQLDEPVAFERRHPDADR